MSKSKPVYRKVSRVKNPPKHPAYYGYRIISEGNLIAYLHIFECFTASDCLGRISALLAWMDVLSPTSKDTWSKEIISNEKFKTVNSFVILLQWKKEVL